MAVSKVGGGRNLHKTHQFLSFSPCQIISQGWKGTEEHLWAQREMEEGTERGNLDVVGPVGTGFPGAKVG